MSRIQVGNFRHPDATDDAITLTSGGATQIAGLTYPTADGSNGQYLQTNGSGTLSWAAPSNLIRATAQSTASGSGVTFTGIPSTARKITVMFDGVSASGSTTNDAVIVQIGSGSITTSGYTSVWMYNNQGSTGTGNVSAGFPTINGYDPYQVNGWCILTNVSGNTWVGSSVVQGDLSGNDAIGSGSGKITLSGTLDRVRVTTIGSTFDGGSVNLMYETE